MRNILVVEDDDALREALRDTLELVGYQVIESDSGLQALELLEQNDIELIISDVQMQKMDGISLLKRMKELQLNQPVVLMTAYGSIQQAVEAMHLGASDYLVKPFEPEVLVSKVSEILPDTNADDCGFVAVDEKTRTIMHTAMKVASSDATVLVTGPSGAGKEVLVRFIHKQSDRNAQPFVAINCAAIPDNMLEAILFGYTKGAFTGAYKSSPGKFEQAQDGTLLLDEISEMSLPLQAKLLRVLQEREVERLGDQKSLALNVRVMATSNRDLRKEVVEGRFREDLYYRLNVFRINLPALAERPDDIVPLVEYFLSRIVAKRQSAIPSLSTAAICKLSSHHWPGNIRELDNILQRACILMRGNCIQAEDIQFESDVALEADTTMELPQLSGAKLKEHENTMIINALKNANGSRKTAAEELGISPRTLRYKLARLREQGVAIPAV